MDLIVHNRKRASCAINASVNGFRTPRGVDRLRVFTGKDCFTISLPLKKWQEVSNLSSCPSVRPIYISL